MKVSNPLLQRRPLLPSPGRPTATITVANGPNSNYSSFSSSSSSSAAGQPSTAPQTPDLLSNVQSKDWPASLQYGWSLCSRLFEIDWLVDISDRFLRSFIMSLVNWLVAHFFVYLMLWTFSVNFLISRRLFTWGFVFCRGYVTKAIRITPPEKHEQVMHTITQMITTAYKTNTLFTAKWESAPMP